ncbi:MAG: DUF4864 domain-containing protein [Chloroflexi bacterium]|nr:DUF4864 domain-containing protein [Chloroflexota bacterium]
MAANDSAEGLYQAYLTAEAAGNYQQAFDYLYQVEQRFPGYRDASGRLQAYTQQGYRPSAPTAPPPPSTPPPLARDSAPAAGRRGRNWLLTGVLGCVGLLVLCGVLGAAIAFFAFSATSEPVKVVEEFFDATTDGDLQRAYGYFRPELQREQSFAEFSRGVQEHPEYFQVESLSFLNRNIQNNEATLRGEITAKNGTKTPARFRLVSQNNEWKIIGYNIGPGAATQ